MLLQREYYESEEETDEENSTLKAETNKVAEDADVSLSKSDEILKKYQLDNLISDDDFRDEAKLESSNASKNSLVAGDSVSLVLGARNNFNSNNQIITSSDVHPAEFLSLFYKSNTFESQVMKPNNSARRIPPPPPLSKFSNKNRLTPAVIKNNASKSYDDEVGEFDKTGPWAPAKSEYETDKNIVENKPTSQKVTLQPLSEHDESDEIQQVTLPEEQMKYLEEFNAKRQKVFDERDLDKGGIADSSNIKGIQTIPSDSLRNEKLYASEYVGKTKEIDYLGRSWIHAPNDLIRLDRSESKFFMPKRKIHTFKGHNKGVQSTKFIPKTGHLLLSAGLEGVCKIWSCTSDDYGLKRDYSGHSLAVKSIDFCPDSRSFVSTGFDSSVLLWDVETGQTKSGFRLVVGNQTSNTGSGPVPLQARFWSRDTNVVLVACSNHKLIQYDFRIGSIASRSPDDDQLKSWQQNCQEYNYHQGAVNTVAFIDDEKRFISTGDDKKMLVWEMGLPVPTQYITDIQTDFCFTKLHPNGQNFACQSLQSAAGISVFDAFKGGKKVHKSRTIKPSGQKVGGFPCEIDFSPCGSYLISGDSTGKMFVYDWKTGNMLKKFQAHNKSPCVSVAWNPNQTSKVATAGWDGLIHYWD